MVFFSNPHRVRPGLIVAGALLVAGLFAVPAVSSAQDTGAAETADTRIDTYLAGVTTLRAGFRQVLLDERGETVDESTGTLYLSRPDRFRWEYENPFADDDATGNAALAIIADGERLWVYDAELAQATVKRMDGSLASNPAMLLSGRGKVSDGFDVVGGFEGEGVSWTELKPKESDTDFQRIRLGFRNDDLAFMELKDSLDQVTRIEFQSVTRNVALSDARFVFDVPGGVDVIGDDPLYDAAVEAVRAAGRATSGLLQESLVIDAQRAAGLIVALRDSGVLGERGADGVYAVRNGPP